MGWSGDMFVFVGFALTNRGIVWVSSLCEIELACFRWFGILEI